ncbi:MAG TPA: hypothetical protein VH157_06950 [Bryobacteraceae bacterium]|nr:hypothetical protein [Bryobacteraceae bacterium]
MPSTYTQNLGLEKPATGEQAGVWGTTANTSYDAIDMATDGNEHVALSASSYTLNTAQGATAEGRNKVIIWTGTLSQAGTVNITPSTAEKLYIMTNATAGGFPITFQQGSGGVFTLNPGYSAMIYCDGAGANARVDGALYNPQFGNVQVLGSLSVSGAVSFAQATTFTQPVTFQANVTFTSASIVTVAYLEIRVPGYASAAYDLYYQHLTGSLVPLPIGAVGQVLGVVAGPALAWTSVGLAVGNSIGGSAAYGVYFSNASNVLAQSNVYINPGVGLGLGGVPGHTLHIGMNVLYPEIWIDTAQITTQSRQFIWATNGSARWNLYTPAEAESGGNAGSNLLLLAYNDSGGGIFQTISFFRASGNVTVGGYADIGARLAVLGSNPNQYTLVVRGAPSQNYVQVWQNSAGQTIASIDGSGNPFFAGTGGFVNYNSQGRVLLGHPVIGGAPLATLHIAQNQGGSYVQGASIVYESAIYTNPADNVPANCCRMYFHSLGSGGGYLVVQFYYNGSNFYASLPLSGGNQTGVTWNISQNAL